MTRRRSTRGDRRLTWEQHEKIKAAREQLLKMTAKRIKASREHSRLNLKREGGLTDE